MRVRIASDSGLSSDSSETCDRDSPREMLYKTYLNTCVRERVRDLNLEMSNIRAAKSLFSRKVLELRRTIDGMTREISACAHAREQRLKSILWEIKNAKVLEWNRQMKVCEEAGKALDKFGGACFAMLGPLQVTCSAYAQSIGFIDAGRIEFQRGTAPVQMKWELVEGNSPKKVLEEEPRFVIGETEEYDPEFNRPWGVCCDPTGRVYVADRGNDRIQVFDRCGRFLLRFGSSGSGEGEFDHPAGITVDSRCRVIVSDKDNHRVQVFTLTGRFVFAFGQKGTKPGLFQYPWDVAVDGDDSIAVSDTRNRRIQLFDDRGAFVTMFDFVGSIHGVTRAVSPRGVVFTSNGDLLATDFNNHCILLIEKGFAKGRKWGECDRTLFRPQGIAYDGRGTVAVVDSKNNLVQVFDESGNLLRSFGRKGRNPGEFDCLQGVCFQPNGNLVVSEFGNNRVQVF